MFHGPPWFQRMFSTLFWPPTYWWAVTCTGCRNNRLKVPPKSCLIYKQVFFILNVEKTLCIYCAYFSPSLAVLWFGIVMHKALMSQLMRSWYLSHRRTAKPQARLRMRAVSSEPSLFAHIKYGSRRRVWQKFKRVAPVDCCISVFEDWVYGGR